MTIVKVNSKGIIVAGHSGYDEYGKDIVCASISTLVESTYRYLISTNNKVEKKEDDGYFEIEFKRLNNSGKLITEEFKKIVKDIEENYFKYVRSEYNEET